jgi:hypothetical protein
MNDETTAGDSPAPATAEPTATPTTTPATAEAQANSGVTANGRAIGWIDTTKDLRPV